jgi:hypothetical protein
MYTFEYSLVLSTGEKLAISEVVVGALDSWCARAFSDPNAKRAIAPILALCTKAPPNVMDDAKIGHTKPLEKLLKTPPIGALMKIDKPICSSFKSCASANASCTTQFVGKNKSFPKCWDYYVTDPDNFTNSMSAAQELVKDIVMAWRDSRYVVICG